MIRIRNVWDFLNAFLWVNGTINKWKQEFSNSMRKSFI